MMPLWTMVGHSLRRVRALLLGTGALLAAFQCLLILAARSIQRSQAFDQLNALIPPFVRDLVGPALPSFLSFQGIVCVGYFHLAVLGALTGLSIAFGTTLTGEVQAGWMDLLLARPLGRHLVVTRSVLTAAICVLTLLAMMMAGTWLGLQVFAPPGVSWPAPSLILSLAGNLGLLLLSWTGIATAIGAGLKRRATAAGVCGLLALGTFLLDYLARVWDPARSLVWLSPFRYYAPFELLSGQPLSGQHLLVLSGLAGAGFLVGYFIFARRDILH
ncbi:MAG: ABC transporter permease subunit [Verrucomicrobiota bacterium]